VSFLFLTLLGVAVQQQAFGQANQRPIEDFLAQQGQSGDFTPTTGDLVGWIDFDTLYFAWVDYAGLADEVVLDGALGTSFNGKVTERPLKDGRTQVLVKLTTRNALAWAFDVLDIDPDDEFPFESTPLLFGARVQDVLAGATPALGSCTLQVKFIHDQPINADLPDLVQLVNAPTEDQELLQLKFHTSVAGELREQFGVVDGTPGRLNVSQNGLYNKPNPPVPDEPFFPVEKVVIKVVGN
jgi:hypothetical protein